MAINQVERHRLGRLGESIANGIINGKLTNHKHPIDIKKRKILWEVKTISANSKNHCIHISHNSLRRKLAIANKRNHQLRLMIIVVFETGEFEVYTGDIRQHCRPHQLGKMEV